LFSIMRTTRHVRSETATSGGAPASSRSVRAIASAERLLATRPWTFATPDFTSSLAVAPSIGSNSAQRRRRLER
jgi:hypothetical protein